MKEAIIPDKHDPPYGDDAKWPLVKYADLEAFSLRGCQCGNPDCGKEFTKDDPMEMAVQCHLGAPVWVGYWDGYLYISCAVCSTPVCRVKINPSLL